ncbi:MAG TPA: caspase family protein [Bryobacteraceae bacterium]|nr:caspase family protein [Bryobacteraceae bacterium]
MGSGTLGASLYFALSACMLQAQAPNRDLKLEAAHTGGLEQRGRLWAVVIGISKYDNVPPQAQLHFADRDAQEFAAFLRSPSGGGFPSDHIQLLLNERATLPAVRTALGTWLPRSAERDDLVYVFFAGHGVAEGDHDGYLLARDSDPQNLYATALSISELDRIVSQRLRARNVVLIADACHAGNLGWASRGSADEVLVSRYLTEIGRSGEGILRLLASRADERSYEDQQWGGGHGAFTYSLLEGLRGQADRDHDGIVRAGELIEYVSSMVPQQTKALQHPQAAGHIDPAMALAIVNRPVPVSPRPTSLASLEIQGAAGTEVYLDNRYFGRIRPAGTLVVEELTTGAHELSVDPPGGETITRRISLAAGRTRMSLNIAMTKTPEAPNSPLVVSIRQAIVAGNILDAKGAWELYQRLIRQSPGEPERAALETSLSLALEETGQRTINEYLQAPLTELRRDTFHRAAQAFSDLEMLRPGDAQLQAKRLFCTGRALVIDGKFPQAVAALEQAAAVDPRAGYIQNALGISYERLNKNREAVRAFQSAARLCPAWALPHLHLGLQYQQRGEKNAEQEFKTAVALDPRQPLLRETLATYYRGRGQYGEAERELMALLETNPGYGNAYRELAGVYESRREYGRAADALENYLKTAPNAPDNAIIRSMIAKDRSAASSKPPSLKK